jgi:hypothetical protein
MDSVIALLQETPIPTILVVSGLIFLFLALAGKISGKLEMPPERQKWSGVASAVLLSTGLLLYILPLRTQSLVEKSNATLTPVAPTEQATLVQPQSVQSSQASPSLPDGYALTALDAYGECFVDLFAGISPNQVERVETGVEDKRFSTNQMKNDPAGIILTNLGQPVVALTYIVFEEDNLIKISSVVDASCHPVEFINSSRGGARDVLLNWDSLKVTTGTGVYSMRFGYFDGMVELDTLLLQE